MNGGQWLRDFLPANAMHSLLRFIPKNHLSWLVGQLARIPLPQSLRATVYGIYSRRYGVEMQEVDGTFESFSSLADFFTRELKAGARPISPGIVSPVDGTIVAWGESVDGRLTQIKGKTYSVSEFIGAPNLLPRFRDCSFVTIYLAPGDYHHIHSPVNGEILDRIHVEGKLWPVNTWSVSTIENLFAINERVVTLIRTKDFGDVIVAAVGATNVGSIRLAYEDYRTNQAPSFLLSSRIFRRSFEPGIQIKSGDKLATFAMGSTVVLLFEKGRFKAASDFKVKKVKFGEQINS